MNAKTGGREYFGFLRLFFASMVILSHTPELHDGNRSNEFLTNIFGTVSFGGIAIDSFFFISGYLISQSFLKSKSPVEFISKRIRRIYPAFLVAYLICVFVVAPLGGGLVPHTAISIAKTGLRALFLLPPAVDNVFPGSNYPDINGAMWTILYEFKCYLMVLVLGMLGFLNKRHVILALTVAFSIACVIFPDIYVPYAVSDNAQSVHAEGLSRLLVLVGEPRVMIQLVTLYLFGILFRLYRAKIILDARHLFVAISSLIAGLFVGRFAHVAIGIFWGYAIIFFSYYADNTVFSRLNEKSDISYGVYLYAWPVQKLLFYYYPAMNGLLCGTLTFTCAACLGMLSWFLIERKFVHQRPAKGSSAVAQSENLGFSSDCRVKEY